MEQIVESLHRNELMPFVFFGYFLATFCAIWNSQAAIYGSIIIKFALMTREIGETHKITADISGFPTVDDVVECFQGFFEGYFTIQTVSLEDVDVCTKLCNTGVYSVENVLPW